MTRTGTIASLVPLSAGRRLWLWAEFIVVFVGMPLLVLVLRRPGVLFAALWIGALGAWAATRREQPAPHDVRRELRALLVRFAVLAPLIALATWVFLPDSFLDLPRQRPVMWAMIMVLYPLLSVWPQEMLYRGLLFTRYARIFGTELGCVAASAVVFGLAHVIFENWVAVAMTTVGGWLFARDFARHRSLRLTCLEHSLYGYLIFTIGLRRYFYTGTAWHH